MADKEILHRYVLQCGKGNFIHSYMAKKLEKERSRRNAMIRGIGGLISVLSIISLAVADDIFTIIVSVTATLLGACITFINGDSSIEDNAVEIVNHKRLSVEYGGLMNDIVVWEKGGQDRSAIYHIARTLSTLKRQSAGMFIDTDIEEMWVDILRQKGITLADEIFPAFVSRVEDSDKIENLTLPPLPPEEKKETIIDVEAAATKDEQNSQRTKKLQPSELLAYQLNRLTSQ
jgi:hypothetical protein